MITPQKILLLGAGELGQAFLLHLITLLNTQITIGVRSPSKYQHLATSPNISLTPVDHTEPVSTLAKTLANYSTIITCTGFGQPAGTQKHLTEAVLSAGQLRRETHPGKEGRLWYFPWQWGVNYDITGDANGRMPLFGEQLEVRQMLRARAEETHVKWTIVSTGIFMSFLFEPFWGVVDTAGTEVTVRALGYWEHRVTVTDVNDIGKCVARIVAGDVESENRVVYIAGDTVNYKELACILEKVTGQEVKREEWTVDYLRQELEKDSGDQIKKYRMVFAGDGVAWDKKITANYKLGMQLTNVESWTQKNLKF
ncbi:NAD(P)-binding protein [Delitschia confertaspora ATCC 74209]|uniref:NAD(P)-binding protein n=1 Tax=Delitschia confertaspora ATCC 74209 TaxID=1513339 RepID=A0A9P4JJY8_9PLEO|nr:NAD(P)-binding protein [Delitschia confertaspora ATCC 74209]